MQDIGKKPKTECWWCGAPAPHNDWYCGEPVGKWLGPAPKKWWKREQEALKEEDSGSRTP